MAPAENAASRSFVLLHVGERRFALPADIVTELAPPVRLHTFPHAAPMISGVIVRRAHIVPVYDTSAVLTGRQILSHRFYLIARREFGKAGELSAIPVDGECELATGQVRPAAPGSPKYIAGTLEVGDESIEVLDFEALVTSHSAQASQSSASEAQS